MIGSMKAMKVMKVTGTPGIASGRTAGREFECGCRRRCQINIDVGSLGERRLEFRASEIGTGS
ncbi:MAG TPA: hypothetical protein DCG14_02650 [Phycisphaerales bacterium]|nr:hypothetical protein [Phycisphaerales bacterium]